MANPSKKPTPLEREQEAFDAQLDDMLKSHPRQFVLFSNLKPVEFFADYDAAYSAGLARFGIDGTFLVSQVIRRKPQTTSVAWEAGVMFR